MIELKDLERLIPIYIEQEIRQIQYFQEKKEEIWKATERGKSIVCHRFWADYYMREEDVQVLFCKKFYLRNRLIHALNVLGFSKVEAGEFFSFWIEKETVEPAELEIYLRLRRFADSLFTEIVFIEVGEKQEGMRKLEPEEEEKLLDFIYMGDFFVEKK